MKKIKMNMLTGLAYDSYADCDASVYKTKNGYLIGWPGDRESEMTFCKDLEEVTNYFIDLIVYSVDTAPKLGINCLSWVVESNGNLYEVGYDYLPGFDPDKESPLFLAVNWSMPSWIKALQ